MFTARTTRASFNNATAVAGLPGEALARSGDVSAGTMQVGGHDGGTMTVSGMVTGTKGSLTMTMSGGSMMSANCSATATGTFDMDDMMTELHGTYSGMNTCTGPFDHGQMTMTHR